MSISGPASEQQCPSRTSPTFCILPWIHFSNVSSGKVGLCCSDYEKTADQDGKFFHSGKESIEDIWNSTYYRQARLEMSAGKKRKGCAKCYFEEELGVESQRLKSLRENADFIGEASKEGVFVESLIDGRTRLRPFAFDIHLGNRCNLRCIMCDTRNSSRLNKEMGEFAGAEKQEKFWNLTPIEPSQFEWANKPEFWRDLHSKTSDIVSISLNGGEPTLIPEVTTFFEHLLRHGDPGGKLM